LKERQQPFNDENDEAIKTVTLYRHPSSRVGTTEILPLDACSAATLVKGKVVHVNRGNKAVGPIYTLVWEDGLRETNINTRMMFALLAVTPRSLGHGTPITPEVVNFLEDVGKKVGKVLYDMRTRKSITKLISTGYTPLLPAREVGTY
jgi:hypothetical protein